MSQRQLAKALGVSTSTVANWERGASYPLKLWAVVEDYLGITIARDADEPAQAAS